MVQLTETVLAMFRKWGRQGGHARKRALSPEQRIESARKAGQASAAKRKKKRTTGRPESGSP